MRFFETEKKKDQQTPQICKKNVVVNTCLNESPRKPGSYRASQLSQGACAPDVCFSTAPRCVRPLSLGCYATSSGSLKLILKLSLFHFCQAWLLEAVLPAMRAVAWGVMSLRDPTSENKRGRVVGSGELSYKQLWPRSLLVTPEAFPESSQM